MKSDSFKFDEIGIWSEIKLDIIEQYGAAYVKAFANNPSLKKYYIDGFSGAGSHRSKATGELVEGSPARALKIVPPFDHFFFIDLNKDKTQYLRQLCAGRANVSIFNDDSNKVLIESVLPKIKYENYNRALCLLDPYGLDLDWRAMELAGKSGAVDLVLNFPVMDMNRNAIWKDPTKVSAANLDRMNRFWGDDSWKQAAYKDNPQFKLFSGPDKVKQDNDTVVDAFCERLKKVAGFKFVAKPLPMKNTKNAVVYYLMLASPKEVAKNIVESIFGKYR